ncbi:MAG TPA: IS110 family transposase [Micrococcaceae bacterium]
MAKNAEPIQVVHGQCCGLDVHKKQVQACVLRAGPTGAVVPEQRSFGTTTEALLALLDWLVACGCTAVAMESTGMYWKPIYNLFEGELTVLVVNAQHIKQVPGRKTDVSDAAWIAGLLRHGLLTPSFIPDRTARELREVTRFRRRTVEDRTAAVNRLHKTLEGANSKLASVASDLAGRSAREMLALLVSGTTDPHLLAAGARGKRKEKMPQLEAALAGSFGAHQRFMVALPLGQIADADALLATLDAAVARRLAPFATEVALLDTIPGVGLRTAEELVAAIGVAMTQFPDDAHLASWAGMAPGHQISAGKRTGGKTRRGSRWLRATLVRAAQAVGRSKDPHLGGRFRALAARRGKQRAAVAVGHTILTLAYHILRTHEPYHAPLPRTPSRHQKPPRPADLVQQLRDLGFDVTLTPAA